MRSSSLKGSFLVVDDEEYIQEILKATLAPLAHAVFTAGSAEEAWIIIREENLDVVVSDIRMPGLDGLSFLQAVRTEQPWIKFLMITAHGSVDTVIRAMRSGASDFLTKPFNNEEVRQIARRLLSERQQRGESLIEPVQSNEIGGIIGVNEGFRDVLKLAGKAALSDSSVLLQGESGTGKEVLAKAIHENGKRKHKPLIAVNCSAIPEHLIESELFGYEKGAFTGANFSKPGKFTLASGGTIFLDEIGEMSLSMQSKLLRVLQEKVVDPVGAAKSVPVDFRLITATNRNLRDEVQKGAFRQDLYYRIRVVPIDIPPLRERGGDILLLAEYFLKRFNERYEHAYSLTEDNRRKLVSHSWPGNIRELENTIERAVVTSETTLQLSIDGAESPEEGITDPKQRKLRREKEEMLKALDMFAWNKTQAAHHMGVSRRSLLYKIKEYGLRRNAPFGENLRA